MNKYAKIRNDVRNKIISGKYKPGTLLPKESEMILKYNASKLTVKKAMDELVNEGLIIKRRGSGTFVKGLSTEDIKKLKVVNQFQGFSAFFADKVVESRILVFEVVKSEPEIMERLGLSEISDLYHVVRTRLIDGDPYVIESTYMPVDLIKNLTFEICSGSIYEYIEDELGLTIGSAHRRIEARKGTDEELVELGGKSGDPVVLVSQVGYLSDGRTFEASMNVHRYDKYAFETVLMHKN
ncbi:GntR family transcriptional regulator [Lactococcus cremoris]|uniref:GntR family transcriptional regulator n=1 Tax=Lactococcus lactis subsp. cremoris TaxID=1359 RepID=A0A1V0PHU0_LACLC|nr:GntR family transcriptional regulator [Lactococcus cremoris]ARE28775.1 GntR family transcriptional regulator [Lactococcus cremoris]EUN35129.1 transcriptional regulator GntR family [Lactococcus cremoris subsp. cremoris HP]KZK11702.1 regulatory protein GntR HTH [Lactococcus cremoris]KZK39436.1 regulatory protein GntR HTH [Lactococcus cremoris]KZK46752.1 regulatory protein GntR HTH [Lactococcus cremoris]